MKRNVFISVLGYGNYSSCRYAHKYTNGVNKAFVSEETRYVQTATIEYIYQKNHWSLEEPLTCIFLMDKDCYNANWVNHQVRRYAPYEIDQPGLEACLVEMQQRGYNLSYQVIEITAPSGDDQEIWSIFKSTFDALEEEDSLYFDVTHSFRSHPIMIMVLNNYAKLLRSIKVKSITYGNYEIRDTGTNIAPIIDLTPLNELQDWTLAASTYLETGHIDQLQKIAQETLGRIDTLHCSNFERKNIQRMNAVVSLLDKMVDERLLCRGRELTEAKTIGTLYDQIREDVDFGERMPVFEPIFEQIRQSLSGFDDQESVMNVFMAAHWCYHNKQYQQCITLLEESLISVVCDVAKGKNIPMEYGRYSDRRLVATALHILKNSHIPRSKWDVGDGTEVQRENARRKVDALTQLPLVQDLTDVYDDIRELRNDYNHAGIQPQARSTSDLRLGIKRVLAICEEILIDEYGL